MAQVAELKHYLFSVWIGGPLYAHAYLICGEETNLQQVYAKVMENAEKIAEREIGRGPMAPMLLVTPLSHNGVTDREAVEEVRRRACELPGVAEALGRVKDFHLSCWFSGVKAHNDSLMALH
jgi:hypothetical protein